MWKLLPCLTSILLAALPLLSEVASVFDQVKRDSRRSRQHSPVLARQGRGNLSMWFGLAKWND